MAALTHRDDIDGLRAVAVLSVVLYHAGVTALPGGYLGVDVFFVISGFLITAILRRELVAGRFSLVGFYERRARRILPALFVVLAAVFVAGWFLLGPRPYKDLARSAVATTMFISNIWFRRELNYFTPAADLYPLLHTWSLAVEEQFYIVFPLLLYAMRRWSDGLRVGAVLAVCAASFALSVSNVVYEAEARFFLSPPRAWELGLGALLALARLPAGTHAARELIAGLGLLGIFGSVALLGADTATTGLTALPACLGTAALIWAGTAQPTRVAAWLAWRPVVFVGLISYSLYLWHWPVLVFLRVWHASVDLPTAPAAAGVLLAVLLATLSWAFVERPFRRPLPQGFSRPLIFGGSLAAALVALVISYSVWRSGGVTDRFAAPVLAAYAVQDEWDPVLMQCFGRRPDRGLCYFGAVPPGPGEGPADFLLWGDSHAIAMTTGVAAAAASAGYTGMVAGKGGCPPLLGLDRADMGPRHDCSGFNGAVFDFLRSRTDLPLVILAARWAFNAEGTAWSGPGERFARLSRPGESPPPHELNFELFRTGLGDTVAAIRATGRRVVLLGDMPEIGWNVPGALALNMHRGVPIPALPQLDEIHLRQGRAEDELAAMSGPGIQLLSLAQRLCNPVCRVAENGVSLYRDDHHISNAGALATVAPQLTPIFATTPTIVPSSLPAPRDRDHDIR
jgi:peptidoglycan/LPS O-acetylase OafA/YrhL